MAPRYPKSPEVGDLHGADLAKDVVSSKPTRGDPLRIGLTGFTKRGNRSRRHPNLRLPVAPDPPTHGD